MESKIEHSGWRGVDCSCYFYNSEFCLENQKLSSSPSHPVLVDPLPVPYLSPTCPLPVPHPSLTCLVSLGLSRSHKGTGTDTIFEFSHPPPPTSKLFRSLYSPLGINNPSITHPLPVPCLSLTCPLSAPYLALTCPLLLQYRARPYRNSSCLCNYQSKCSLYRSRE